MENEKKRPMLLDENGNHMCDYLCIYKEDDLIRARFRYDGSDDDQYDNIYAHINHRAQLLFESQQMMLSLMEENVLLSELGKQLRRCFVDYNNRIRSK